jgi:enolase
MKITDIHAREILDSRGIPTISTEIELLSGVKGVAEVPSGASTGKTEVLELRDKDMGRYHGKGVLNAVNLINTKIKELVVDKEFSSQKEFDDFLIKEDGTENKSNFGGNTILSCSMAFARAVSNEFGLNLYEYLGMIYWDKEYNVSKFVLPTPQILVMEGGKHGNWATDIQEYMIVPNVKKFGSFSESLRKCTEVFHTLHDVLDDRGFSVGLGYEGAYAPKELESNQDAFDMIIESIEKSGMKVGEDFSFALDLAASEFYKDGKYTLQSENKELDREEWIAMQREWYGKYPIYSIEDPLDEEDWEGWSLVTKEFGEKFQVVGDDLLTTNTKLIQKGIDFKSMNSVLIKLNQIGTVTETLDAIRITVDNGMKAVVSHRSGETNDDFIADLVIATPADQSKFGGVSRGERLAKYNRLLKIEEILAKR